MTDPFKTSMDAVSITTTVGTLAGLLPSIAAVLTIVWTVIRIYETQTVQRLLGNPVKPTRRRKSDE